MGIQLKHLPKYRLDIAVYTGSVTATEVIQTFNDVDPQADWLCYFDGSTDLSQIDVADMPAMKQAIVAREAQRSNLVPGRCALVNLSGANELYAYFWSQYASAGVPHAHERIMFQDIESACRWLELEPDVKEIVDVTIGEALRTLSGPGLSQVRAQRPDDHHTRRVPGMHHISGRARVGRLGARDRP